MPFPLFAPAIFFEDAEIAGFVMGFSERVRRDVQLRPVMDRLVGNQWESAEASMDQFLRATMFLTETPQIDANWLARAIGLLRPADIDALAMIALECALAAFPLHSAAVIASVVDRLASLVHTILATQGLTRQKHLLTAYARLRAGALMSGL